MSRVRRGRSYSSTGPGTRGTWSEIKVLKEAIVSESDSVLSSTELSIQDLRHHTVEARIHIHAPHLLLDVVQLLLELLHVGVGGVLVAVVHCGRRGRGGSR